jgi:hypothetical protein
VYLLRTRMEMLKLTGAASSVGDLLRGIRLAASQLNDRIEANTMTRVPLAWVVRLQNYMPFFEAAEWRKEHVAQEHRRLLWRPPYFEPGDTVTLFGSVADYLGEPPSKTYTVLEIDDRWLARQTGSLPTMIPDPGIARLYRLDGLSERVSHCALRVAEPQPVVRLFGGGNIRRTMCASSRLPRSNDNRSALDRPGRWRLATKSGCAGGSSADVLFTCC